MTEINNIHNYGYKIDRIEPKRENNEKAVNEPVQEEREEQKYIADTGILGRSQVHNLKGGNIEKSINESVDMAENFPIKMQSSGKIFDFMYNNYLNSGMSESDAYMLALLDEGEFLDITQNIKK